MAATAFYNEKAEKSLLAAFATDPNAAMYIGQLVADDFKPKLHRDLFAAMQVMQSEQKTIDLVTIFEELKTLYGTEANSLMDALVNIVTEHQFGSRYAIKSHVAIVKASALRRRMSDVIDGARAELSDDSVDTQTVLDHTRQLLRDLVITGHTWVSMSDVLVKTYEALERRSRGEEPTMPSGIKFLDMVTTGFHKGEMTIIGARPSVGKSALGAHIAMATAAKGYKVGICSREMTEIQYGQRVISRGADIDSNKLRTGDLDNDDWEKIINAMELSSNLNVSFVFSTRYIEDLRAECQNRVDSGEMDMLVVDYIQLMQCKQRFDADYLRIAYVSKMLKDMSTELNIAVIALAQVGRGSEGQMPTLSELRGSGDLEQDADNVIFMHRPIYPGDKFIHKDDQELFARIQEQGRQYIALNVAKQRQGQIGPVAVIFDPAKMRFTSIDRRK